jgi:glutamate synthase (NADPH/NADH) large chain
VADLREENVNTAALASGELVLEPLGSADLEILRDLLERHLAETDSAVARRLLDGFEEAAERFTKVLPRDYAAVLATRQSAVEEGLDPDGDVVWTRIMEVTGG